MATEVRRPFHLAWLIGLSASLYAGSLAAVTEMQAASDGQVADQQATSQRVIDQLRTNNGRVSQEIERAAANLQAGALIYANAGKTLTDLEQHLAGLGKSAGALRALPAVPSIGGGSASAPVVHSTTGASGAKP